MIQIAPPLQALALDGDARAWDAFVRSDPESTVCHLSGWREIMSDVLGHRCEYWMAVDADGEVRGMLPLVQVRSRLLGHYWVSLPFLNDGGPLGTPGARLLLEEKALRLASHPSVHLLELRSRERTAGALQTTERKITVHLPLPATTQELWEKTFRSKLRSQIRRPIKEGMETGIGPNELEPFYEVFSRNMRDLGTPVLPRRFFEAIRARFPEQAVFACTYHQGKPVAAGAGFLWNGEFEITWASSLREFNHLSPNMLLYCSLMEHSIAKGARLFNFGRCTPGASTHRFKLQWGGYDVPLPWSQWSPSGVSSTPSPDRPLFQLATAAWRRLPLGIANRAGPILARRLP
jgi:FemAB-related protein (PEP-CTERM system-associated)